MYVQTWGIWSLCDVIPWFLCKYNFSQIAVIFPEPIEDWLRTYKLRHDKSFDTLAFNSIAAAMDTIALVIATNRDLARPRPHCRSLSPAPWMHWPVLWAPSWPWLPFPQDHGGPNVCPDSHDGSICNVMDTILTFLMHQVCTLILCLNWHDHVLGGRICILGHRGQRLGRLDPYRRLSTNNIGCRNHNMATMTAAMTTVVVMTSRSPLQSSGDFVFWVGHFHQIGFASCALSIHLCNTYFRSSAINGQ